MVCKKFIGLLTAFSLGCAPVGQALACTSILVTDAQGRAYHGRTFEYNSLLPMDMAYLPAGTAVVSATPSDSKGLAFDTKYGILAVTVEVVPTAKQATIGDGSNDQGLTFSANWLKGTDSPTVGGDAKKILAANDLGMWVLGNFKTAEEVKQALTNGSIEIWVPDSALDPNTPLPLHYAINDKTGGSIVVEFLNGKTNVYDNPVGVMTNGPEFPWHLTNLQNYTFSNVDKNTGQFGKLKLQTQDGGIALSGLPSAETSQGRFVKAAFYANYVRKGKTPDEAVVTLAHIMNNFDRPVDLSVDEGTTSGDGVSSGTVSEVTILTVLKDLSRNLVYVRSIKAMNWSVIDMNKLADVKAIKKVSVFDINQAGADAYKVFYQK
jgi:penicillin V acylase-like amidase (Ntn superfamily)